MSTQLARRDRPSWMKDAVTAAELADSCGRRLPPYKWPRYIEFIERWPLTETNKIVKTRRPKERNDVEVDLVGRAR